MKTANHAINKAYTMVKASAQVTCPVFLLAKQDTGSDNANAAYVVINSLPIAPGELQKIRVNINYHCPDLAPGIPDYASLETMTGILVPLFDNVYSDRMLFELEFQGFYADSQLNEHYSNIRLNVKILN
jgi:hypothetical protein